MGINDIYKMTPEHKLQVAIGLILLVTCLIYFIKEVIREFPILIEIFKQKEEEETDE